jgi:C4-dicarboxylate transporter DctQ subunit
MQRLFNLLARATGAAMIALILVIIVAIFAQVIWRYALNNPLIWPEEVARYSFIWVVMLGTPLLIRSGESLVVDILLISVSARTSRMLQVIATIAIAPLLGILIYYGIGMMNLVHGERMASTGLPMAVLFLSAPVGGVLGLIFGAERVYALLSSTETR